MKGLYLSAGLLLCLAPMVMAQDTTTTQSTDTNTTTTEHVRRHPAANDQAEPMPNPVKVDADTIKAAQSELHARGYNPGPQDGVMGPETRAAVDKFQTDQRISRTGRLDADTLSKLNVGGTKVVSSAPADLGRGAKAAGHDLKGEHPVEAGKDIGRGSESFGKKIAKGTKALAVHGVQKAGGEMSKVGNKVEDKTREKSGEAQSSQSNPPER